jgi:GAF domain-containing protein
MQKDGQRLTAYVRKVQEEAQRLTQDLLNENDKLRGFAASFENENMELRRRIEILEGELEHNRKQQVRLQQQLATIEKQSREFADRFVEVEQQSSHLTNLYVATYQLHGTLDRHEVLAVIQEIIINLVGSEEMAVLEVNPEASKLDLIASFGVDPGIYENISLGRSIIGRTALTGDMYLAEIHPGNEALPEEEHLTVCIPLKLGEAVRGVIAVFRLLPHKPGLEAVDHELFHLLATQAATALYCTALHSKLRVDAEVAV